MISQLNFKMPFCEMELTPGTIIATFDLATERIPK